MGERFPLVFLVPLRLLAGVIFLLEGWDKLRGDWLHGTPLMGTLGRWVEGDKPYAFFLPIIQSAQAHPKIFGSLVTLGELAIGVSLLLGVLTRLGSFLGVLMLASFALGAGQRLAPPGNAIVLGAVFVLFVLAPPGRVLGLDVALRHRLPRWLV